jgi:pilus assembly protein CpaB
MNLNSILKNRTVIGLLCISLSLLICFGLTPLFNNALKSQTEIIRVTKDIKKGEAITSGNTEKVKVGAFNLPVNLIKNTEEVTGKYAVADLMKGDFVLTTKLTNKGAHY